MKGIACGGLEVARDEKEWLVQIEYFCGRNKNYLLNLLVFKQAMMSKYMKYELWGFYQNTTTF